MLPLRSMSLWVDWNFAQISSQRSRRQSIRTGYKPLMTQYTSQRLVLLFYKTVLHFQQCKMIFHYGNAFGWIANNQYTLGHSDTFMPHCILCIVKYLHEIYKSPRLRLYYVGCQLQFNTISPNVLCNNMPWAIKMPHYDHAIFLIKKNTCTNMYFVISSKWDNVFIDLGLPVCPLASKSLTLLKDITTDFD